MRRHNECEDEKWLVESAHQEDPRGKGVLRAYATNQCTKGVDEGGGEILQFHKESTEAI